jgi:hypothetical protein
MRSSLLLHTAKSSYDRWLKLLLGGTLAFTLILGIVLIPVDILAAGICLGVTAFDGLIFWAVLPHALQIYEDRVRIQLGGPLAVNLALANIKEAKKGSAYDAVAHYGVRFATSMRNVVIITRHKGWNVVISPDDADEFITQLRQAQQALPREEP